APGIAMSKADGVYVINLTNVHRKKEEIMKYADVLVLKNICDADVLPILKTRKNENKLTVYELADDLCAIPPWNPVYPFYSNHENQFLFKRIASHCDAMQFSVYELHQLYSYLNPNCEVFTNQMTGIPSDKNSHNRGQIVVGWGGSHGHLEDLAEISEQLIDWILLNDFVSLHLMCSDTIWKLFERLPASRKRRFQPGSLEDYFAFLKTLDIGLAPLKDTAFNRSRSDVKFLEYAIHEVIPVVRAQVPYMNTVKHGENGFLYQDSEGLLSILDFLSKNPERRMKIAISVLFSNPSI
ncbi:MAG: hypothetical protein L7F78_19975, partial [Syntrophales bacterium LBB04]|nr:hypothetical protein [Syntrophales bacterium LBB04]